MDKQTFISELTKSLTANHVQDIEEIITEYDVHFSRKIADGYSEAEIAHKLGKPQAIAQEYREESAVTAKTAKFPLIISLTGLDICTALLFIVAGVWTLALAAVTFACACLGACLIAAPLFPNGLLVIPYLPYIPGALLGLVMIAVGLLFGVLTIYCFSLIKRSATAFSAWQKAVLAKRKSLRYPLFPLLDQSWKNALRRITIICVLLAATCFTVAYIMMAIQAGSWEFWHVWGWFGYVY